MLTRTKAVLCGAEFRICCLSFLPLTSSFMFLEKGQHRGKIPRALLTSESPRCQAWSLNATWTEFIVYPIPLPVGEFFPASL